MVVETSILEELDREGFVVISTRGTSMKPLLHEGHSQVLIEKLTGRLEKNDVVLYQRWNSNDTHSYELVLHRLIGFDGDTCLIRGDNTYETERVPIADVKGIMTTVWYGSRGNRELKVTNLLYRLYVFFWNLIFPVRRFTFKGKRFISSTISKILGNTALAWILRNTKPYLGRIAFIAIGTAFSSVLSILLTLIMRDTIDYAVSADFSAFGRRLAWYVSVVLINIALSAILRQLNEATYSSLENSIKARIYDSILHSSLSDVGAFHTGELQNRLNSDVSVVAGYATGLIPDILSTGVQLVLSFLVLFAIDWRFTSIFVVGSLAMLGVTFFLRERMKTLHKRVQEADGRLRSWMQESVENLLLLKSFQAEDMATRRTQEKSAEYKKVRMQRRTFSNLCTIGYAGVMNAAYFFGFVWCCFGILAGTLTFGTLAAVLQLVNQVSSPFAYISSFIPQYYTMIASTERLIELEEIPKDVNSAGSLPEFRTLCAKDLCFAYKGEDKDSYEGVHNGYSKDEHGNNDILVLDKTTFEIKKGEIVAITGRSGAGKSTLIKLLLGIYSPISGRLYAETVNSVNDHTAVDINASTRAWFSYVPQGNMLMSGSIYEAVDFLHLPPYTDEQKARVKWACNIACADDFIEELPAGYNTILGEKGVGLSEGQLQRIAIARAIYRNAPILLLDEASSALDEATERQLLDNLKNLTSYTVLVVTHRPAALEICDRKLVIESNCVRVEDI